MNAPPMEHALPPQNETEERLLRLAQEEAELMPQYAKERERLRSELEVIEYQTKALQSVKRTAIQNARADGMPVARIARLTGLSRQRIYQIVDG